jgi:hypothetical protein
MPNPWYSDVNVFLDQTNQNKNGAQPKAPFFVRKKEEILSTGTVLLRN